MEPVTFFNEAWFYLFWGGSLQFFWAIIAAPLLYLLACRLRDWPFHRFFSAYVCFNVFLLLWGCIGSYAFMAIAYGKLYTSVDRLVDWYAFIPFGQWVLDDGFGGESHGRLLGNTTLSQLRLLWLAVALPVWLLAFGSVKLGMRLLHGPAAVT